MDKAAKKANATDFTTRPLLKKTIMFALPMVLTSVLQLLYSASDIVVLGLFAGSESEAAVAAVGSTGALINLITNLFIGLSVGALAVAARNIGARDPERLGKATHTSVLLSIICGVIVGALGFFMSRTMLKWMDTPDSVIGLSALYLKIYFLGIPFNFLYNFESSILRACGDTKRPLVVLAIAGVVNVAFNIIMVACLKMSVAGVGIATVASEASAMIGVTVLLMRRKDSAKLVLRKLRIDKSAFIDIFKIGLPAGLQGTIFSLSNVIIQSSINGFGDVAMAGNAAASNTEGFVYVAMNSIAQACLTVAGQNYGAAKPENIDLSTVQCTLVATGIGLVFGGGVFAVSPYLLKIYGCSGEGIAYGVERLSVICTTYFLCGIMEVLVSALRAIGYSLLPMLVSVGGVCGIRILWVNTVFRWHHTLVMLQIGYPVSWFITLVAHLICYLVIRKKVFKKLREMRQNMERKENQADNPVAGERLEESTADGEITEAACAALLPDSVTADNVEIAAQSVVDAVQESIEDNEQTL